MQISWPLVSLPSNILHLVSLIIIWDFSKGTENTPETIESAQLIGTYSFKFLISDTFNKKGVSKTHAYK
jgi:hypothetical protein